MDINSLSRVSLKRALNYVFRSGEWTEWDGAQSIDLTADIEITGTPVSVQANTPSASGANTLIVIGVTERLKLYKVLISPASDVIGEVYISVGATKIGSVQNPKSGGQYILISTFPDYYHGALGDDLTINIPSAIGISVNTHFEVA